MDQLNMKYMSFFQSSLDKELFELQEEMKYVRDFGSGPKDRFTPEYYDFELNYEKQIVNIITKYETLFMRSL